MTQYNILITGGAAGIGHNTALALAKAGHNLTIIDRTPEKERATIESLNSVNPNGTHNYFALDLSKLSDVREFLEFYKAAKPKLDALVLNAGVFMKKLTVTPEGFETTFAIGAMSRYLFASELASILAQSPLGRIVHINGSVMGKIRYEQLSNPKYSSMTSVWQNSVASALMVQYGTSTWQSDVKQTHWNPGVVETKTVTDQNKLVQWISSKMGMISPVLAGQQLSDHILSTTDGKHLFMAKGLERKQKPLGSEQWQAFTQFMSQASI